MDDQAFAEKLKWHPIWRRDETHDQILKELDQITKISAEIRRKIESRKRNRFQRWSIELGDLYWSTDHILKHTNILRDLLSKNANRFVSRGFEKRVARIKRQGN